MVIGAHARYAMLTGGRARIISCVGSADGEPGQLITRGANLMSGYVANAAASAKALGGPGGWCAHACPGLPCLLIPRPHHLTPSGHGGRSGTPILATCASAWPTPMTVGMITTGSRATRRSSSAAAPTTHTSRSTPSWCVCIGIHRVACGSARGDTPPLMSPSHLFNSHVRSKSLCARPLGWARNRWRCASLAFPPLVHIPW